VALEDSAPVLCVPLVRCVPFHAPEAVQEVALVEDQLNVELPPLATFVGLALNETLGAADEVVTIADCAAVPPAPVQVRVYLVAAVRGAVALDPFGGWEPLQPPEAVQAVALVADQLNIDVVPLLTVLGLADKVTAGAAMVTDTVADWDAVPPVPEHVRP
jgi:hypothetical protein